MQNIKLNFSKSRATIVIDDIVSSFEINTEEITKLKDFVLKYNFNGSEFYLKRIKGIVEKHSSNTKKVKDFSAKLQKNKLKEEIAQLEITTIDLNYFRSSKYFTVVNKDVFLKNTNFILPEQYLDLILKHKDDNIEPYINFMYNLSSNPNEAVRDKVWNWIEDKGFKITENGYIFGARWVVSKNQPVSVNLAKFVNSEYVRRKLQKKSPKNYTVYIGVDDKYFSTDNEKLIDFMKINEFKVIQGNLEALYLDNELVFTDAHTGKDLIKLGFPVKMDRKDCDESQAECSTGKHFGALKDINNLNFGDQLITVLVDPKNITSLPHDSYRKARCCEYFPYSLISKDDVTKMLENDNLVINDVDYESINLDVVLTSLKEKTKLYKTNGDKIQAIKAKISSLKVDSRQKLEIVDFNRIVKL